MMNLAEFLFNAYNNASPNPGKTFDGRPVPEWLELGSQVQAKWEAVAKCATANFEEALKQFAKDLNK